MADRTAADRRARQDFRDSRRRAARRAWRSRLVDKCNDLVPAGELLERLAGQARHHRGPALVPLDRIVGSTGRYRDFDLAFQPRHDAGAERWVNVARARYLGIPLPRPLLWQVGDAYFVEDGHHRISVARARGQREIEATVTEIEATTLTPNPTCRRLGFRFKAAAAARGRCA